MHYLCNEKLPNVLITDEMYIFKKHQRQLSRVSSYRGAVAVLTFTALSNFVLFYFPYFQKGKQNETRTGRIGNSLQLYRIYHKLLEKP